MSQKEETKPKFVYPAYIWFNRQLYELTFGWTLPEDCFVAYTEGKTHYYYKLANYLNNFTNKKTKDYYIKKSYIIGYYNTEDYNAEDFLEKHRVLSDCYNTPEHWKTANDTVLLNINDEMVLFKKKEIDKDKIESLNKQGAICFVRLNTDDDKYGRGVIKKVFYLKTKKKPTRKLMWRDFSVHDEIKMCQWIYQCLDNPNDKRDFATYYRDCKKHWNKNNNSDNMSKNNNTTNENNNNNLQNDIKDGRQEERYVVPVNNAVLQNNLDNQQQNNDVQQNYSGNKQQNNAVPKNNFYNQKIENNQFSITQQANVTNYANQQTNNNITQPPNNIIPKPNNIMPKNYPPQNIIQTQQAPLLRPIPIYRPNYYYMPTYYRPSRPLYRTWMHKYTDGWRERNQFNRYPYYFFYPTSVVDNTQPGQYARTYYRPKRGLNGSI